MQRDILEMIQQLPQKIGDTEAHITNSIDIKCSALEDNVKQYIKVLEKCTKNLIGHSRLAFNNHESNIDC